MVEVRRAVRTHEIGPIAGFALDSKSVGANSIRLGRHVLPPGRQTTPHYHDVESAVYMVKTGAIVFVGEEQTPVTVREGDFLFIPAYEIHSAYNPSKTETHISIVVQAGSTEESVGTHDRSDLMKKGREALRRKTRRKA